MSSLHLTTVVLFVVTIVLSMMSSTADGHCYCGYMKSSGNIRCYQVGRHPGTTVKITVLVSLRLSGYKGVMCDWNMKNYKIKSPDTVPSTPVSSKPDVFVPNNDDGTTATLPPTEGNQGSMMTISNCRMGGKKMPCRQCMKATPPPNPSNPPPANTPPSEE